MAEEYKMPVPEIAARVLFKTTSDPNGSVAFVQKVNAQTIELYVLRHGMKTGVYHADNPALHTENPSSARCRERGWWDFAPGSGAFADYSTIGRKLLDLEERMRKLEGRQVTLEQRRRGRPKKAGKVEIKPEGKLEKVAAKE